MKSGPVFTLAVFASLFLAEIKGQDSLKYEDILSSGISIEYGLGNYSVKDEYVSREIYSGMLPYYSVEWVRFRNTNGYRLKFEYRYSSEIKNNSISAQVQQFSFDQDFFYPLGSFLLFSRNVYAFAGPSLQFFYYDIHYTFARPGTFINPRAFGNQGSLGVNADLIYFVNKKLFFESFFRSNLLSVTSKFLDEIKHTKESPALMIPAKSNKIDFEVFIGYFLINRFSLRVGYKLDFSRINEWDPYIAASDNLIASIHYKF
jgi:hypothetical protein